MNNSKLKTDAPPIITMGDVICVTLRLLMEARGIEEKAVADIIRMTPRTFNAILNRHDDAILSVDAFHTLWTSILKLNYKDLEEIRHQITNLIYVTKRVHISDYAGPKQPDAHRISLDEVEQLIAPTVQLWARRAGYIPREFDNVIQFHKGI